MSAGASSWRDATAADLARLGLNNHASAPPKTRQKYSAIPHVVLPDFRVLPAGECEAVAGGIRFASKKEALRFVDLRLELEAGRICDLLLQEQFALHVINPQGVKVQIGTCRMDFTYTKNGQRVREDVKGAKGGEAYQQRKRHFEAEYGIRILETRE